MDGGQSWQSEPVTRDSTTGNVRPFVIRKAPPGDPYLMWMNLSGRYVHYTDYRTALRINRSVAVDPAAVLAAMCRVAVLCVLNMEMKPVITVAMMAEATRTAMIVCPRFFLG